MSTGTDTSDHTHGNTYMGADIHAWTHMKAKRRTHMRARVGAQYEHTNMKPHM